MWASLVAQSSPTLSNPMDCSPPGSSVHGIFQARVLERGAIAFSGGYGREYIEHLSKIPLYLHELHCIDMWKLLIDDSPVLANHIEKSHFRSGCWNLHKLLKWQTISVTLIEILFSRKASFWSSEKVRKMTLKNKQTKTPLIVITSDGH